MKLCVARRMAILALLIGAPLTTASAADMPVKAAPMAMPVVTFTGPEIGISVNETTHARQCISSNDAGANGLCDTKDPVGAGFNIGYGFRPWANNWIVEPFAEVDFPNVTVNHNFGGGAFMGTRTNYDVLTGLKIGPTVTPDLWIYGIGGVGFADQKMTVNFATSSSATADVFGGVLGAGAAWEPAFLQGGHAPVSLSFEYHHTWWDQANYNNPTASPGFNYGFKQQDNTFLVGLNVYFGGR